MENPKKQALIISPCRSGSTALMRALGNHSQMTPDKHFQSIKEGQRRGGGPDYGFYDRMYLVQTLLGKETVGYANGPDCTLAVFPSEKQKAILRRTLPVFLFREPTETYDSWLRNDLVPEGNPALCAVAYKWTWELYKQAQKTGEVLALITYQDFCERPETVLRDICEKVGYEFEPEMMDLQKDLNQMGVALDKDGVKSGHYSDVNSSTKIERKERELRISSEALACIEAQGLKALYQKIHSVVNVT